MRQERFIGVSCVLSLAALAACSSSNSPSSAVDAGISDAQAAPVNDAAAKPKADAAVAPVGDSGQPQPTPTPPPPPPPPGNGGGGGPVSWKSGVGFGGIFAQTFDDATWSARPVAKVTLFSVACAGNLLGWAAGENGYVAHTIDGGATWGAQDAHLSVNLRAIRFGGSALGVVAGDAGSLAVTHDGGAHWSPLASGTTATLRSAAVAIDAGIAIVVGDGGTVLRSGDSGGTWGQVVVPGMGDLRGVASDDGAHVVLAVDSAGVIWSSWDGAQSFAREAASTGPLDSIALSDDGTRALATGRGGSAMLRVNGAWHSVQTGTTVDLHAALVADGASRLYLAGESGTLVTSTDDGAHWTTMPLGTSAAIYALEDL